MSEFKFIEETMNETKDAYEEAVKKLDELGKVLKTNQELISNNEWKGETNQQCNLVNSTLLIYNELLKEAIEEIRGIVQKLDTERTNFNSRKKREVKNIV